MKVQFNLNGFKLCIHLILTHHIKHHPYVNLAMRTETKKVLSHFRINTMWIVLHKKKEKRSDHACVEYL